MTAYSRQTNFSNGDVIDASLFNAEYDQLAATFALATGHSHDGTDGEGGYVPLIQKEDSGVYIDTTNPSAHKITFKVAGVVLNDADGTYFTSTGVTSHTPSGGSKVNLSSFLDGIETSISDTLIAANNYTDTEIANFTAGSGFVPSSRTINGTDLTADVELTADDVGAIALGEFGIGVTDLPDLTVDADTLDVSSSVQYLGVGSTNIPMSDGFVQVVGNNANNNQSQLFYKQGQNRMFFRSSSLGTFAPWVEMYTTENKPTAADVGAISNGSEGAWSKIYTANASTIEGSSDDTQPAMTFGQNNVAGDAFVTFHVGGHHAVNFGLDANTQRLSVGGWSEGAVSYSLYTENYRNIRSGYVSAAHTVTRRSPVERIDCRFAQDTLITLDSSGWQLGDLVILAKSRSDKSLRVNSSGVAMYLPDQTQGTEHEIPAGYSGTIELTFNGTVWSLRIY